MSKIKEVSRSKSKGDRQKRDRVNKRDHGGKADRENRIERRQEGIRRPGKKGMTQ